MQIMTPVLLPRGYIDWVYPWRASEGQPAYLYGEDFDTPYCPVIFVAENDYVANCIRRAIYGPAETGEGPGYAICCAGAACGGA